jgi:hypothetical protein
MVNIEHFQSWVVAGASSSTVLAVWKRRGSFHQFQEKEGGNAVQSLYEETRIRKI